MSPSDTSQRGGRYRLLADERQSINADPVPDVSAARGGPAKKAASRPGHCSKSPSRKKTQSDKARELS